VNWLWDLPALDDFDGHHLHVLHTLVRLAQYAESQMWTGTSHVVVPRGSLTWSISAIAAVARVSDKVAWWTIEKLVKRGLAKSATFEGTNVRLITLCHYEEWTRTGGGQGTTQGTGRERGGNGQGSIRKTSTSEHEQPEFNSPAAPGDRPSDAVDAELVTQDQTTSADPDRDNERRRDGGELDQDQADNISPTGPKSEGTARATHAITATDTTVQDSTSDDTEGPTNGPHPPSGAPLPATDPPTIKVAVPVPERTWIQNLTALWCEHAGVGSMTHGQIGKTLKSAVDHHTEVVIATALHRFLAAGNARYGPGVFVRDLKRWITGEAAAGKRTTHGTAIAEFLAEGESC
jgi:hypothetical protein